MREIAAGAAREPALTAEQIREQHQRLRAEMAEEAARHQREARERARRSRHQKALERAAIPPKYQGLGFEGFNAELPEEKFALNVARDYAEHFQAGRSAAGGENSPNLLLLGGSRCGKTHLACAIAEAVMDQHTAVVAKLSTILVECREVYNRDDQTERDILNRYVDPDLLVIDEVGEDKTGNPDFRAHKIGYIIDERVENLRPTVIAGNITDAGLSDYLGERTYNRLVENSLAPVIFSWTPYLKRRRDTPSAGSKGDAVVMRGVFPG